MMDDPLPTRVNGSAMLAAIASAGNGNSGRNGCVSGR